MRGAWTSICCVEMVALLLGACSGGAATEVAQSSERGRLLLEQYDCGRCHEIPGVRRASGVLGPSLQAMAGRAYIAGELPNQPDLLQRWIEQPSALVPDTLMPDQQVPQAHARDMATYLAGLH